MFREAEYRRDVQVLRGLAVVAVVLFHAEETYFPLGYLGVDVFFVISGFVVTPLIFRVFAGQHTAKKRLSNLKLFYVRRFYRLAPALGVTIAFSAILIFFLGAVDDHQRFSKQGIATLLLVGNLGAYKYSGDYFSANPNPLVHTWSLSVEEQIYLLLPLVLMIVSGNHRNVKKVSFIALSSITLFSFTVFILPKTSLPLYSILGISSTPQFSFYSPIERIWQFTVGSLLFFLRDRNQNITKEISKVAKIVIIITLTVILFSQIQLSAKFGSILATLFTALIIEFKTLNVLPGFFFEKLEWIGNRSYSVYLVHMPLMYLATISPATQIGTSESRVFQSIIAVAASIILGSLSYSRVENRYRNANSENSDRIGKLKFTLSLTLFIPLVLFIVMDRGSVRQYWGIDRNVQKPKYAGFLDPKCERDSYSGPPCEYRANGAKKTVLLLGDSHAGHISQAVIDGAKSEGWNAVVWTHSGCVVQFRQSSKEPVNEVCIEINNQKILWIVENRPDLIIVSQFVRSDSSQKNLRNALAYLESITPNVLLVENNPIFPDEKDFMVSRPIIMSPYSPPKYFPISEMQTKHKDASDKLANWARSNGISTLNLDSLFCKDGICSRYSDKGWLYRDDDHFSVIGAELTIPKIREFLNRI